MRTGRIRIESGGLFQNTRVFVVPDDGGEEIHLPVTEVSFATEAGEPVHARLGTYPKAVEVEVPKTGRKVSARSRTNLPATYPDMVIAPPNTRATAVAWTVDSENELGRLTVSEITL